MQSQRRNNLTGEETAGKPPQEPPSPQNLRCFQDVLHIVSSLTDREWRTLSEDVPHAVTKLQFATLCTKIILSDSKSAVQSYLPSLLRVIGMEAVLRAEQNVREKAECASVNPSGSNTAEETSHKRSPVDQSDLICHIVEDFASEVKMAMESLLQMSQLQHPKRSSDPVPDTSCVRNSQLRDPGQGPSSLNYFVVDETVVTLLKHLLSLNTRSSPAADPSTSAGSKGQDRHSDKSVGSQCESPLTKVLTDSQSRIEDSLLLLVDPEQTEPDRNQDVSLSDIKSPAAPPTTSSRASSTIVTETLDDYSMSSQDYETYSSSSSPSNGHYCSGPNSVAVKKSGLGFRFIVCKKAPLFSPGKTSSKVYPVNMMSDHHLSTSSSGNHEKSEQRESGFRRTRKNLSRIFTAIRKALPNPFQCMTPRP